MGAVWCVASARMGTPCEQSERGEDFILTACILRKDKNNRFYYQAELKDSGCKNSVLIVAPEKVKKDTEI